MSGMEGPGHGAIDFRTVRRGDDPIVETMAIREFRPSGGLKERLGQGGQPVGHDQTGEPRSLRGLLPGGTGPIPELETLSSPRAPRAGARTAPVDRRSRSTSPKRRTG